MVEEEFRDRDQLMARIAELALEIAAVEQERDQALVRVAELEREKQALSDEVESAGEIIERLGDEIDGEPSPDNHDLDDDDEEDDDGEDDDDDSGDEAEDDTEA